MKFGCGTRRLPRNGFDNTTNKPWWEVSVSSVCGASTKAVGTLWRTRLRPSLFPAGKLIGAGDLSRVDGILLSPEDASARQYALYFNGTNTFARIDNAPDLQLKDLTIEAWVKPEAPGTLRTILMKGDIGYGLFLDVDDKLRFSSGLDPSEALQSDGVVSTDGQWHHVAVVVDSIANTTAFYIDGRWVRTVQAARVQNNSGPLILGKFGLSVNGAYFKGSLDEVRLWNVARSAAQIASLASSPLPRDRETGLVAYYNFDEGAGTLLADTARFADHHRGYLSPREALLELDLWKGSGDALGFGHPVSAKSCSCRFVGRNGHSQTGDGGGHRNAHKSG
jgi:hypothetical protein